MTKAKAKVEVKTPVKIKVTPKAKPTLKTQAKVEPVVTEPIKSKAPEKNLKLVSPPGPIAYTNAKQIGQGFEEYFIMNPNIDPATALSTFKSAYPALAKKAPKILVVALIKNYVKSHPNKFPTIPL